MKHILSSAVTFAVVALVGATVLLAEEPVAYKCVGLLTSPFAEETDLDAAPVIDDLDCTEIACCFYPQWTASVSPLFLHRNDPEPRTMIVDPQDGSELINALDLKPGWGSGPRFEITRHLSCDVDLEFEFFSIDNWANHADAQNASPSTGERFWDPFVFDDIQAYSGTDLYNLELNVRWPLFGSCWLKGLAGFRYIQLNEEFFTQVTLSQGEFTATNWGQLALDNQLCGFQLGLEPVLWDPCGPLRVDGLFKAGIFGNDVDWLLLTGGDLNTRRWEKKGCRASCMGEVALKLHYDLPCRCCCCSEKPSCCEPEGCAAAPCPTACRRWSLFAGYEAFWMNEVATAEQLKRRIRYDCAIYHGVFFGLEISFGRGCCTERPSCAPAACQ